MAPMSLCMTGGTSTLRLCGSAGRLSGSAAHWLPLRRLALSTWYGAGMKSVSATQGRTIASSAAAEPLARGGNEGAPAGSEQQQPQQHGAIEIVVGPMFAGKTTELLRRVASYEAAGLRVAVVKSNKDDRYCAANVVTHDGLRRPCFASPSLAAFKEAAGAAYSGFQVIAVDEAQFFPDLQEFCTHAADHEHKRVVLAGLDGDFQRQRFGQVLDLLPLADSVTKLSARCKFCAQEERHVAAVFSLRITADSRQEVVGGADVYAPVCRRHYVQLSQVREVPLSSSDEA
ncbi:hypothetical protein D9Q98_004411 [Chlorella vulgaris]|uniref:Thymidine kinase n=1 Tax=Chlorella vulgaris TaxID=3077 RepID=A0A9D4TPK9_CHLVU|nr:hypothetical protein D9Q98_004411 [Chlorella vulgaris]